MILALLKRYNSKVQNPKLKDRELVFELKEPMNAASKENAMTAYSTVHVGPKSREGGAQDGFISCAYQL
jgi:hypothetical protein